ncbi:Cytochrome c oxidase assembly protein cox18, mitochondrial [Nowakowskiella sp. JEL0078]|nr:Cytochrome c oxidase assembly protein cox18, mitochondrial [Nowakowskiella sp. JEL0078]
MTPPEDSGWRLQVPINPVGLANSFLLSAKDLSHAPWWAAIVGSTILLRATLTFPIALVQRQRVARLKGISNVLKGWEATLRKQVLLSNTLKSNSERTTLLNKQFKAKRKELFIANNCRPIYTFILPWAQIPLFLSMSLALRKMSAFPIPFIPHVGPVTEGFTTGGILWFTDLSLADSTLIFPVINRFGLPLTTSQKYSHNFFRFLALSMIPMATHTPMVDAETELEPDTDVFDDKEVNLVDSHLDSVAKGLKRERLEVPSSPSLPGRPRFSI